MNMLNEGISGVGVVGGAFRDLRRWRILNLRDLLRTQ